MSKYFLKLIALLCVLLQYSPGLFSKENFQNSHKIPADVSYLAVDLKYHPERGVQICEIQHGVPSMLGGDAFTHGGDSVIAQNVVKELSKFYNHSWISIQSFPDPSLRRNFSAAEKWIDVKGFKDLVHDKLFLECAAMPVIDPTDLASYHGFVFMNPKATDDRERFKKKYPGVLLIDNAVYKLRRDKFKMTELLMGNELTEKHKPKWGRYNLDKETGLAEKIINEIGSDLLVIKPLDAWKGRGIIILKKEDLSETLEYLFKRKPLDTPGIDSEHTYWLLNKSKHFIVEEFIEVEPSYLHISDGKLYSPTMRLVFLLFYSRQTIEVICLGGYTYYPQKSISDEGTLTEKYKTACGPPYYSKCDPEIFASAAEQMKDVLYIVYKKLLELGD
ncbi:MAG: hypothetical protein H0U49_07040 [Parachlamydiaceae bacterium]|nr:hypothetical protein [Parachlamydiaceae bacterium]